MDTVNIYIMTTNRCLKEIPTAGEYIIEVIRDGVPTTYPPPNKDTLLKEITTGKVMINKLLCNALYILKYLTGLKYDHADVYMEPYIAAQPISLGWINKWQQDNWHDAKGNPVDDTYRLVKDRIDNSVPLTFHTGHHSYSDVMARDLEKYRKIEDAINTVIESKEVTNR